MDEEAARFPKPGEFLVLVDGRRFVVGEVQGGVRGWWFRATAQDGSTTLQGNLSLEWDPQLLVWRPARSNNPLPPSMRRTSQSRQRQLD